jgi:hypothetical protein
MQMSVNNEARQDNFQIKLCQSATLKDEEGASTFLPSRHAFSLFSFVTLVEVLPHPTTTPHSVHCSAPRDLWWWLNASMYFVHSIFNPCNKTGIKTLRSGPEGGGSELLTFSAINVSGKLVVECRDDGS